MADRIKIDKNIPLPKTKNKSSIYPFEIMQVGESFFVPDIQWDSLYALAQKWKEKYNKQNYRFKVIEWVEHPGGKKDRSGARIWRTK